MKTIDKLISKDMPLYIDSKLRSKLVDEAIEVFVPSEAADSIARLSTDAKVLMLYFAVQSLFVSDGELVAPPWIKDDIALADASEASKEPSRRERSEQARTHKRGEAALKEPDTRTAEAAGAHGTTYQERSGGDYRLPERARVPK